MKKKQRYLFKRFAALVAALVICFAFCIPCSASNNWPASPSSSAFYEHPNCWYVWQNKTLSGVSGYELICFPMQEYENTNTSLFASASYSTNSGTYSFTNASNSTRTFMYAFPYIPLYSAGSWSDLPSFPVGMGVSRYRALVRIYPVIWRDYLKDVSDVFSDKSVYAFLTSWPSTSSSSIIDHYDHEVFNQFPIFVPSNIFFFGSKTDTSTTHSSFIISGGDNAFWATPSNDAFLSLSSSHISDSSMHSFSPNSFIPSADIGFVFCKRPSGDGLHVYNSEFDITLSFVASLWVPDALLPSNVKVGDWISKATVEDLQDELANEFDINSDTLHNSKDNLNSWSSSLSVDSDLASGASGLLGGLFQNLGTFLFSVSLLCFGAVVLRMLIRKAVDG